MPCFYPSLGRDTINSSMNMTQLHCTFSLPVVVTCTPDDVLNSTKSPDQPSFNYSTDVTYTCDTGYELASGYLTRTCQANATWSGAPPVCTSTLRFQHINANVFSTTIRLDWLVLLQCTLNNFKNASQNDQLCHVPFLRFIENLHPQGCMFV